MKKYVCIILLCVLLMPWFCFFTYAEPYAFDEIKKEISEDLSDVLTEEVKDVFDYLGVSDFDYESIYNVSFRKLITYFTPEITEKAKCIFKNFFELFSVLMILVCFGAITQESGINNALMLFGCAVITVIAVESVAETLNSCLAVMKLSGGFIAAYVPVFTLILAFSGNPASALVYNSFVLGITEVMSVVINGGLVDFIGCFICLSIAFSFNESLNTSKLINAANKTATIVLSISASLFSGILTVKNIMAVSLDGVSVKGVRFLISSFIPIIGSAISEAYSSVLGSINLIKSSVAVIGILAVVIINLPVVIESLFYYFMFSALSYISSILGCKQISDLFGALCSAIRLMLVLVVFQMFILLISTGIILTFVR